MAEEQTNDVPILSRLRAPEGATRPKRRVGRGLGSGIGKTGGRGQKGQKARQPGNIHKLNFEGGQMPLARRVPKFGFTNVFAKKTAELNVRDLARFEAGSKVDLQVLLDAGLVKGDFDRVKLLGNGEIDRALTVEVHAVSKGARAKVEAAGGTIELIEDRRVEEGAPTE
jgi:large subunit ribosomal protein L15